MKLILDAQKFTLDTDLINALDAHAGDRIDIQYLDMEGNLIPSIIKSDGGNILTKSNTVSFRGEKHNNLAKYGEVFEVEEKVKGLFILHGDGNVIYTSVHKAVQERYFDIKLLLDNQYTLNKFNYEL